MDLLAVIDGGRARLTIRSPHGRSREASRGVHGWADGDSHPASAPRSLPRGAWAALEIAADGTLHGAVDHLGLGVLCWHRQGSRVVVATSIPLLLSALERQPGPDLTYLIARAGLTFVEPERTPFAGVRMLAAGQMIRITASGQVAVRAHWSPRPRLERRTTAEWAAHLGGLLRAALRRSVPAVRTGVMLSGGLDSSTIAGWASATPATRPALLAGVRYPGLPSDEYRWQRAVAESLDLPLLTVTQTPFDPEAYLARVAADRLPVLRPEPEVRRLYRQLLDEGVAVMLSGIGGDELFAPDRWGVEEILLQGRLAELRRWWDSEGVHGAWAGLRRRVGELDLPIDRDGRARRRRRRWITERGARHLGHSHLPQRSLPGIHASGRRRAAFLTGGHAATRTLVDQAMQRDTGMAFRQPFFDVDLVSAALNVPGPILHDADDIRAFQRRVFAAHLPAPIRSRRDKVHFDHRYAQHLAHPWVRELLAGSRLVAEGLLDGPALMDAYDTVCAAVEDPQRPLPSTVAGLWAAVGVEAWWRQEVG